MTFCKTLFILSVSLLVFGCELTPNHLPINADINPSTEGIFLIGVSMNGIGRHPRTGKPYLALYLKKKEGERWVDSALDKGLGYIHAEGPQQNVIVKLEPGTYIIHELFWVPEDTLYADDFGRISLACAGQFELTTGEITYVGNLDFDAGDTEYGFFSSDLAFKFGITDQYQSANKWMTNYRTDLMTKYPMNKSIVGPWACHTEEDLEFKQEYNDPSVYPPSR